MKKCFWVNGNYNGNSCQDAIVVPANNAEEAADEAAKMGVEPYSIEESELNFNEIITTKRGKIMHIERYAYVAGSWYPESFFD